MQRKCLFLLSYVLFGQETKLHSFPIFSRFEFPTSHWWFFSKSKFPNILLKTREYVSNYLVLFVLILNIFRCQAFRTQNYSVGNFIFLQLFVVFRVGAQMVGLLCTNTLFAKNYRKNSKTFFFWPIDNIQLIDVILTIKEKVYMYCLCFSKKINTHWGISFKHCCFLTYKEIDLIISILFSRPAEIKAIISLFGLFSLLAVAKYFIKNM